jgi:hypothetical protein
MIRKKLTDQGTIKESFTKSFGKSSIAQGTIEYLVIMAIIIVIGLVVVGMLASINDSQDITQKNNKLKNMIGSGGISVLEAIINEDGTALITLDAVGNENLRITTITPTGGSANNFATTSILSAKTFKLENLGSLCTCEAGQKSKTCTFTFTVTKANGIINNIQINVSAQCTTDINTDLPIYEQPVSFCDLYGGLRTYNGSKVICNCEDLNNVRNDLTANYVLGTNIDCSDTRNWNSDAGFEPIGIYTTGYRFEGDFNGNNKTISNLYINKSGNYAGLFGAIASTSRVHDLSLSDANIRGSTYVGGIVGYSVGGNVAQAHFDGNVRGVESVGGIIGRNNGTLINGYSTGRISCSSTDCGGIVGYNASTTTNSYFSGTVIGTTWVGGICGNNYGTITNSYMTGTFATGGSYTGGAIGENAGTIVNLYWYNAHASCCGGGNCADCTKATSESDFYSQSYDVYDTDSPNWDGNWIWSGSALPTLN